MTPLARNTAGLSRLVWTAVIVIGASLPHWAALPIWIPLFSCTCVAWRFAARILNWPRPGRWLRPILTIAALGAVLVQFETINGLIPGSALLVVMVSLKFLEARTQRDHLILTVIAYFLVFASLLAGGGLIKGLYLLAFVWITTLGLLQIGRRGALLANGPTAKLAGRLLLQAVPMMVVLFVLFPRSSGPLWALPADVGTSTSGLSGSMSPGDITDLGLSDDVAFRVEFFGQTPAASELYWRGPVLSNFDGRTWTQAQGMRGDVSDTIEYLGDVSEYRVMLEPDSRSWAFAIELPQSWQSADPRRQAIRMGSDYQLRVRRTPGTRLNYTVTSHSRFRANERLSPGRIDVFRRLPPDSNPRTRELIAGLTADSPDGRTIIDRALDVFRADDFFYTLTPPPLGQHTADEFIFETKEGFCEHYASAFAIMMRMAGLPARVVTGYQGGELNSLGQYYIIRQSDAHAWTEVWLPDEGWIRVDPLVAVAPERIAFGSTRTGVGGRVAAGGRIGGFELWRRAALAWDALNTVWNEWVVGYGPNLQRSLIERLGLDRPRWRELLLMSAVATVALMAVLSAYLAWRFRRDQANDPAARSFARFSRRLERLKVEPMRPGETPEAFASRAGAKLPDSADVIADVTRAYLAARYEPDADQAALTRLRSLVRGFRPAYVPGSR